MISALVVIILSYIILPYCPQTSFSIWVEFPCFVGGVIFLFTSVVQPNYHSQLMKSHTCALIGASHKNELCDCEFTGTCTS